MGDPNLPGSGSPGGAGGRTRGLSRFGDYVRTGIALARFDAEAAGRVSRDPDALYPAVLMIAIGGAAVEIGKLHPHLLVIGAVRSVLVSLLVVGLLYLLGRVLLNGRGSYEAVYSPIAIASVILWPAAIPFAGRIWAPLATFWWMLVTVDVLRKVMGLTLWRAALIVGILVALFVFVVLAIAAVFGLAILSLIGLGAIH